MTNPFRQAVAAFATLFLVAACAVAPAPKTFTESLVYAYGTHTAILESTTNSLLIGDIEVEDAENVLVIADRAKLLLDGAAAAYKLGDLSTAEGRLALSVEVLTQLQTYLRSKQR